MNAKPLVPSVILLFAAMWMSPEIGAETVQRPPNFVVIFCDDLGYGDLGCFGHPTIRTPSLDRMAAEGMRLTQFYSASSVCTPSRAALLTGRLPIRSGMCSSKRRVLFPDSKGGLPSSEVTLAEALKPKGYSTACVGKWHLGHLEQFLPTQNGFDEYFGIPYSNDMDRVKTAPKGRASFNAPKSAYWNVPLMRNNDIIERPADQTTITKRYTEEAVRFIEKNREKPFFLYLAHSMPHVPLFTSPEFAGKSLRGLYGDVVEEIDWSVGQVLESLRRLKLAENTLVFFTSDNGPWLIFGEQGGSAGLLREGKGCTFDGGMREPTVAWWPGRIPAGRTEPGLGSTMDIFATCLSLAGVPLPTERVIDGVDMTPLLSGTGPSRRESVVFYRGQELYALRRGPYKAHFITKPAYGRGTAKQHDPPLLFHLENDPSESRDIAKAHPDIVRALIEARDAHAKGVKAPPSQLEIR